MASPCSKRRFAKACLPPPISWRWTGEGFEPGGSRTVIADRFPGAAVANDAFRGQAWSVVPTAVLIDVLRLLRDELGYEHLSDITAVDWMERSPRFDVV